MPVNLFEEAEKVVSTKAGLRKRLLDARAVLRDDIRKRFSTYTIDYENRRMISGDGGLMLVWLNQGKTNRGSVCCWGRGPLVRS